MVKTVGNMDKILQIDSVEKYCELYGLDCPNELVSVVELSDAENLVHDVCNFGIYTMFLKHEKCGEMKYGMTTYDYAEGTIVSIGPGQVVSCNTPEGRRPRCTALLFSPKLIRGTSLGRQMQRYSFFSYTSNEALHMSDEEKNIVIDCMAKIKAEAADEIDVHSRSIVLKNIELLLEYCLRFYDRQFTTRETVNKGIIERFDALLFDYMNSGEQRRQGLPTVKYFADKICLSPNYFGDVVKRLTGRTAQEHILSRLIDMGKEMLIGTDKSVSDIAYDLGFQYPQHFSRFFKNKVGLTPKEFRKEL